MPNNVGQTFTDAFRSGYEVGRGIRETRRLMKERALKRTADARMDEVSKKLQSMQGRGQVLTAEYEALESNPDTAPAQLKTASDRMIHANTKMMQDSINYLMPLAADSNPYFREAVGSVAKQYLKVSTDTSNSIRQENERQDAEQAGDADRESREKVAGMQEGSRAAATELGGEQLQLQRDKFEAEHKSPVAKAKAFLDMFVMASQLKKAGVPDNQIDSLVSPFGMSSEQLQANYDEYAPAVQDKLKVLDDYDKRLMKRAETAQGPELKKLTGMQERNNRQRRFYETLNDQRMDAAQEIDQWEDTATDPEVVVNRLKRQLQGQWAKYGPYLDIASPLGFARTITGASQGPVARQPVKEARTGAAGGG